MLASYKKALCAAFGIIFLFLVTLGSVAQSAGNAASVAGTVVDPSGAVVPAATVQIRMSAV